MTSLVQCLPTWSDSRLTYSLLTHSRLVGDIPRELDQLKHIRILDFSWNRLSGNIPETLGFLPHLRRLDVSNNKMSGIVPYSILVLRARNVEVDISSNKLTDIAIKMKLIRWNMVSTDLHTTCLLSLFF